MAFTEARGWLLLRLWQLETPRLSSQGAMAATEALATRRRSRLSSCGAMAATEALATGDTSAEFARRDGCY